MVAFMNNEYTEKAKSIRVETVKNEVKYREGLDDGRR